tara:strand:- start:1756 stop:2535 length:780 start_codon:yes stop_codon:yes gene_type:complete
MDLSLKGKSALITGSYRGTGAGIASCLAAEGAKVFIHGFNPGDADEVTQKIITQGGEAEPVDADLFSEDGINELRNTVSSIDILINNYGVPSGSSWASSEKWSDEWERNVLVGVNVTQAFLHGMKENNWGRIIFVGTVGVNKPSTHSPGYYGAKASLHAIVRTLAKEVNGTGITANVINPGMIATKEVRDMLTRAAEKRNLDTDWESVHKWAAEKYMPNLTGRLPDPNDIGRIISFLVSEPAWYINGASIAVDGGSVDA